MTRRTIEISVTTEEGLRVPMGLMTPRQALALPDQVVFDASHPDHEAGETDVLLDRDMLQQHVDAVTSASTNGT